MITRDRLKELLSYDPEAGVFCWLVQTSNRAKLGGVAGYRHRTGYIYIGVDGKRYRAHRLAWLYMTGKWPKCLDHCDLDGCNNAFANLREATHSQNQANRRHQINNKAGIKGVYFNEYMQKWQSCICKDQRSRHLGYFDSKEAAAAAYAAAAEAVFDEFARV
jgi:hypothetical protein